MDCQDCAKREAINIIFDMKKIKFYAVCDKCIKKGDKVCPFELIKEVA